MLPKLAIVLTLSLAALAGCSQDQYARMLIEQSTNYGRFNESVVCPSEQLVKNGTISSARRYTMPDKTVIDVWVIRSSAKVSNRGTVLVLHGLCDSKASYMRLGQMLSEKGFDVVLPDLRAHGRSTGKYITYGALESVDQMNTIDPLLEEKLIRQPLYVSGTSLGGTTAILYAAMDDRVQGVLALAAGKDIESYCRPFLARVAPLMDNDQIHAVIARAGKLGDFDPAKTSAFNAIPKVRVPLVLMHGQLDTVVPYSDSDDMFEAATSPRKHLELMPLEGHPSLLIGLEGRIVEQIERLAASSASPAGQMQVMDAAASSQPAPNAATRPAPGAATQPAATAPSSMPARE